MTESLHENLIGEDLRFAHPKWGEIYVRNKRPADVTSFAPDRIVVLQHGATYGSTAFDVPVGGLSWMDYLAARGFDTYCLDLPGYGRSARPPQMSEPAEEIRPLCGLRMRRNALASSATASARGATFRESA